MLVDEPFMNSVSTISGLVNVQKYDSRGSLVLSGFKK